MTPADVRLAAQLVAAGRVHSVSDEAVMVLARRVLVLEDDIADTFEALKLCRETAAHWEGVAAANALDVVREVVAEREACAKLFDPIDDRRQSWELFSHQVAAAIRARGAK